jgi:hypothetical protein
MFEEMNLEGLNQEAVQSTNRIEKITSLTEEQMCQVPSGSWQAFCMEDYRIKCVVYFYY